jgi:hypothetical protein
MRGIEKASSAFYDPVGLMKFRLHALSPLSRCQQQSRNEITFKPSKNFHPSKSTMKFNILLLSAALLVNAATAAHDYVDLGNAGKYVILAKAGISTVPTSNITGNIGVSPIAATAMTGFALVLDAGTQHSTSSQVTGEAHAASYAGPVAAALTIAVLDMQHAYTDAASRGSDFVNLNKGAIGGLTLTPGVYTFTMDVNVDSDLKFNGGVHDVWIIQTTKVLSVGEDVNIILEGRAQAKNIIWQVAGGAVPIGAVIGVDASMAGIMLVATAVLVKTGASLNGRILSQTRVDLQMATIMSVEEVYC